MTDRWIPEEHSAYETKLLKSPFDQLPRANSPLCDAIRQQLSLWFRSSQNSVMFDAREPM